MNWAATMMAFEKIGYDGVLMYEVKAAESPRGVLERAVAARKRLEALMSDTSQLSAFGSQQDE
jgi:sugar phosphate isomerase/epimerase